MSTPGALTLDELVERSRALGADKRLVVFGGGNTSAKGEIVGPDGRSRRVMWIKASGADLASAGPELYPALWLDDLLEMRSVTEMTDEEMVARLSAALVDRGSARPSIETLFHAFVPAPHIDHVHADAICTLTNHADGPRVVAEALGSQWAYVDWMRTGFPLSKVVAGLGDYEGVVLAHHGLVTWADSSDACLERTRQTVAKADAYIDALGLPPGPPPRHDDIPQSELRELVLQYRGRVSRRQRRVVVQEPRLRRIADRPDVADVVDAGVSSADHMLRIKPWSMTPAPGESLDAAVDAYESAYADYVERQSAHMPKGFGMHDPSPVVALVPGVGGLVAGASVAGASMAAEIAVHTHEVAAHVIDAFGSAQPMSENETFRFDYWPLELFKLSTQPAPRPFAGHISIVTGAASGIGRGIALSLAELGASLVLADLDGDALATIGGLVEEASGTAPAAVVGDQSDPEVVARTVHAAVDTFGGLDGVVINAGIGVPGMLDELTLEQWQAALRINLTSAFLLTQEAMRAMKTQGNGGSIVYVASKNAFGPGAGFGAYSVSKAGMVQLMRIAALEGGKHGIRSNAVNPDAVFDNSKLWEGGLREERAAAHGIKPEELEDFYASRNLLHRHVTSTDVAQSVAFLLSEHSSRTTGSVIPVDGGVAAAFPR